MHSHTHHTIYNTVYSIVWRIRVVGYGKALGRTPRAGGLNSHSRQIEASWCNTSRLPIWDTLRVGYESEPNEFPNRRREANAMIMQVDFDEETTLLLCLTLCCWPWKTCARHRWCHIRAASEEIKVRRAIRGGRSWRGKDASLTQSKVV